MEQEEPLDDSVSLEDTLQSLKRNASATETYLVESIHHLRQFQKRVAEESKELSQMNLAPKTRMMKWLTERGLPVECSFPEFFEVFLAEHKQDHRLDLSRRTIRLNAAACILYGVKGKDPEVHILDLMEKLPILYE